MKTDGLYITLSPDGKIKRHLQTHGMKIPLEDTTIVKEIIFLSEQTHIYLFQAIKEIWVLAGLAENGSVGELDFTIAMESFLYELRTESMTRYTLMMTQMEDQSDGKFATRWDRKESAMFVADNCSQTMAADITVDRVLSALCSKQPIDLDDEHHMLRQASAFVTYTFGVTLTAEYQFRSEEQYFIFLLQHFILTKPNVAVCQYCRRYFIPKTRKKTFYCDRIIRDGKTCKEIAPYLKRKEMIAASRVLSQFEDTKRMMYSRLVRTGDDKEPSIVDISYEQYAEWLLSATDARDRYLSGELTEEEAMAIIYVPKKDELLEQISSELTLETTATQS